MLMIKKSATIRDVAREAGVSIASVSYAINGIGTLSDEVRERVRETAKRMGYRPNRSAQAVRTGRSMIIGLIVPDLNNPYYPALAQSIERRARQSGYTVVLIDTGGFVDEEVAGLRQLEAQGAAGAIWCQTATGEAAMRTDFAIPVVVVGTPRRELDNVVTKDFEGGQLLARHLVAMGHSRIGMLTAASVEDSKSNRRSGFRGELGAGATVIWEVKCPFAIDLPGHVVEQLARRDVTAVMCANDMVAIGVLRAARQLGIRVPEELSIVGFDDIPWSVIVEPALTTVRQPVADMAALAMTLLLDRIAEPNREVRHFEVDVELMVRDSVQAIVAAA